MATSEFIPHHTQDRPWMKAVEMQTAARTWIRTYRGDGYFSRRKRLERESLVYLDRLRADLRSVDSALAHAQPFIWAPEITSAVWRACWTVPVGSMVTPSTVGQPQWWWLGWPLPVPWMDEEDISTEPPFRFTHIDGLLIIPSLEDGLEVHEFRYVGAGGRYTEPVLVRLGAYHILKDDTLESIINRTDDSTRSPASTSEAVCRFVMAARAWMDQRIIRQSSGHIERHRRKQLARDDGLKLSDVKIVQLRRTEPQPYAPSSADSVDWSCRWIVNGHWRNQFHPSTGKHELKYILPYVKGPDDKPLKVPTQTVYSVSR